MKNNLVLRSLFFLLFNFFVFSAYSQIHCGVWRWPVKTMTDAGAELLLNQQPVETTIDQILTEAPPKILSTRSNIDKVLPRYDSEKQLVVFTANIIEKKPEGDNDVHLILKDPGTGAIMVGEIPSPDCEDFAGHTELQNRFRVLRDWVANNIHGSSEDGDGAVSVKIQGIKFWDEPGHATGSPANGREIHPITDIITANGSVYTNYRDAQTPVVLVTDNPISPSPSSPVVTAGIGSIVLSNSIGDLLKLIILASLLGMAGQVIRLMVGFKKANSNAPLNANGVKPSTVDLIDGKQLAVSLFIALTIGFIAGMLAAVNSFGVAEIDKSTIIAFIAAGYAGTDLIEGFIINR